MAATLLDAMTAVPTTIGIAQPFQYALRLVIAGFVPQEALHVGR